MNERDAVLEFWFPADAGKDVRLALIIVLDQFSRSVFADSPRAFAQDPRSVELVREGLANGHYDALATVWEKTFCIIPLGHCEGPDHLERLDLAVALARSVWREAPEHLKALYEFQAEKPVIVREVIQTFGRHPHRNRSLGRESTPAEIAYLLRGDLPHQRAIPKFD